MNIDFWSNLLSEIESLQMFALCKDFDALSLVDNTGESTCLVQPSSNSYGPFHRFLRSCITSQIRPSIIENLRVPFIELPRNFMEPSSFQSYNIRMSIGFRFNPGQDNFLHQELKLPQSFDRLSFLRDSLGFSYNCSNVPERELYPYCISGTGLRSVLTESFTKFLVEVITYYDGWYGRFLVLVSLGIGCTVWYGFLPGSADHAPVGGGGLFTPLDSYEPFFNMDYKAPGFHRVHFVEKNDVSASVVSAMENELPFAEINIPASGPVLKAVGLGLMVAFFIAVGLVPDVSGAINVNVQ